MHPTIQKIHDRGIPTGSYLRAIRHLMERHDLEQSQYQNLIVEMMQAGDAEFIETNIEDERQTKYTYLYLVQETIRRTDSTDKLDMVELYKLAYDNAETYIRENPWTWAEPDDVEKVDSHGKPKRKKGAKQEEAARIYSENKLGGKPLIIRMFMEELDMSKAGATTYFYNMRKKLGA